MNFYDDLVMQTQRNYSKYYPIYASGSTPYPLTDKKPLPYSEQIQRLVQEVKDADCVVVGGASGLSAAGGGDFYYEDNDSYRKYFRPFAEKYHFKGAFAGMMHPWKTREEYWGYLATFLHTTQTAPVRHSYLDLDALLKGKDFFILTTNQDTQFVKLYPEEKVAEIQGDHRFFQCAACCTDDTWDAVKPVADMVAAMGDGTKIPTDLIPKCPHCGGEAFPWVRGYGNFQQGKKYEEQYEKISRYVLEHKDSKILFLELGVGRMTPMFIQEPFWNMTLSFPHGSISRFQTGLPCAICKQSHSVSQLLPALLGPANSANPAGSRPGIIHFTGGSGVERSSSAVIDFGSFVKVICIIPSCLIYIYYLILS